MASVQQPIHAAAHILIPRLAHDSPDNLSLLIDDHSARHDLSQAKILQNAGVRSDPDIQRNVVLRQKWLDLRPVLWIVDGCGDELHWLAGVLLTESRKARQFFLARATPRR